MNLSGHASLMIALNRCMGVRQNLDVLDVDDTLINWFMDNVINSLRKAIVQVDSVIVIGSCD